MVTSPPQTLVYLYRSAGISGGLSGVPSALLELTDSTVRCTLVNNAGYSGWLAARLDMPDLKERLNAGEHVRVFGFPRNGYRIKWPTLAGGELFRIGQGDAPDWIVGFNPPRAEATKSVVIGNVLTAEAAATERFVASGSKRHRLEREARQQWRHALSPSEGKLPRSKQRSDAAPAAPQQQIPPASPPPGWYPDPAGAAGMWRYWDGTRWNPTAQPPNAIDR